MKNLMKRAFDKIVFYLACVCVFLPWFTWNATVMGCCRGFDFILALAPPLFVIAFRIKKAVAPSARRVPHSMVCNWIDADQKAAASASMVCSPQFTHI